MTDLTKAAQAVVSAWKAGELGLGIKEFSALEAALAAQQAERDSLRQDAERFRSLHWFWEDERDMAPGGRWWTTVNVPEGKPTVNAAIDVAMGEQK